MAAYTFGHSSSLLRPIVIIGAARSGTRLVRDTVAAHPAFSAVPYDVNYVWRFGQEHAPNDELPGSSATPETTGRIRAYLSRFARRGTTLVEKTVSNSLRVGYVDAVLPDARFIHVLRDGVDVVASAFEQWTAPTDWFYTIRKAAGYPFFRAPRYAVGHLVRSLRRVHDRGARPRPVWGPAYAGIHGDLRHVSTLEVCARQWSRCVECATRQLGDVSSDRVLMLRYEDFVVEPRREMERIAAFLEVDPDPYRLARTTAPIQAGFRGRYERTLTTEQAEAVRTWIAAASALATDARRESPWVEPEDRAAR